MSSNKCDFCDNEATTERKHGSFYVEVCGVCASVIDQDRAAFFKAKAKQFFRGR